jgi:hypothetical protein
MTKKLLFSFAIASAIIGSVSAENTLYEPFDDINAQTQAISKNGRYATGFDDNFNTGFYWCIDNPDEFYLLPQYGEGHGVSNDGVIAGNFRSGGDTAYSSQCAGLLIDGEWVKLPVSDNNTGRSYATNISSDGKYVAGYMFVAAENGSTNYPCLWTRDDETGEYDLEVYDQEKLPEAQGFFTTTMSEDGRILGGMLTCGAGSSSVPALFIDGEMKVWNTFETRDTIFKYKDQEYIYPEEFIDGHMDSTGMDFTGCFVWADPYGYYYGYRTYVTDIVEEETGRNHGTLHHIGFIYNSKTDEWEDYSSTLLFGMNKNYLCTSAGKLTVDGSTTTIADCFGVSSFRKIAGLTCASSNGKVVGGATVVVNSLTGDNESYPLIIVMDEPMAGVKQLPIQGTNTVIKTSAGHIDVEGATNVAIYSSNGTLVSNSASADLVPGLYIVKADKSSRKVVVK